MIDCSKVITEMLMENCVKFLYLEFENQGNTWGFKKTTTTKGKQLKKKPKGDSRRSKDLSQFTKAKVKWKNWRCIFHTGFSV